MTDLEDYAPPSTDTLGSASGTTATAVLITPDFFVCANVGDSRAVLLKAGGSSNSTVGGEQEEQLLLIELSHDHKPTLKEEALRIEQAGGSVTLGRVDGELVVSRALGDFEFKGGEDDLAMMMMMTIHGTPPPTTTVASDSTTATSTTDEISVQQQLERRDVAQRLKVSPFPEVITAPRDPERDRILIVACDGIWDVVSNQECLDIVDTLIVQEGETDMGLICEEVMATCLKQKGSRDNMTIIVVKFEAQPMPGIGGGVKKRRKKRLQKASNQGG
jgi:serine/threonine protein phosphatase PrpC